MFSEMSPQPGASYGFSRQFYFDGIRDVFIALFQLWLSSHAPAMALRVHLDPRSMSSEVCECADQLSPGSSHHFATLVLSRLEVFWPLCVFI